MHNISMDIPFSFSSIMNLSFLKKLKSTLRSVVMDLCEHGFGGGGEGEDVEGIVGSWRPWLSW